MRIPMMLFPLTFREPLQTTISEMKRLAIFTNCAAALAWRPRSFVILKSLDASLGRSGTRPLEGFAREGDFFLAIVPDKGRDFGQRLFSLEVCKFDEHRQVDSRDDLDLPLLKKREAKIRGGAAEHVGEEQNPAFAVHLADCGLDLLAHLFNRLIVFERNPGHGGGINHDGTRHANHLLADISMGNYDCPYHVTSFFPVYVPVEELSRVS